MMHRSRKKLILGIISSSITELLIFFRLLRVNETIFDEVPTIAKMRALFNNYELDSLVNEYVSPIERQEENDFIDEMLKTPVMKLAMKFLQEKG